MDERQAVKKIAIFGQSGSGKSTFAEKLGKELNLPVYHLDNYFFKDQFTFQEKEYSLFLEQQNEIIQQEKWIIEGNSLRSLEMRWKHCDLVLYFHLSPNLCMRRLIKRRMKEKRIIRWKLLRYLWKFEKRVRPLIHTLRAKYPHIAFHELTSQNAIDAFHLELLCVIRTPRLILRHWKEDDLKHYARLNADPEVRRYFTSILTEEESNQQARDFMEGDKKEGWTLWAVSLPGACDFIGFIGLCYVQFEAYFTPAVEIGWRLAKDHWGKGYATEGAKACLKYAFETLGLKEIVSMAVPSNVKSIRVMEKIGMSRDQEFDHPKVPLGHPLRRHVLYRITKEEYERNQT